MLDLDKAIIAISSYINCSTRSCEDCYNIYGMGRCPFEVYWDQFTEVIKVLEKARDRAIDNKIAITEDYILSMFGE